MLTPKSPRCAGLSPGGLPGCKEVHHHRRISVRQPAHPINALVQIWFAFDAVETLVAHPIAHGGR
jgi:hypothetical protein